MIRSIVAKELYEHYPSIQAEIELERTESKNSVLYFVSAKTITIEILLGSIEYVDSHNWKGICIHPVTLNVISQFEKSSKQEAVGYMLNLHPWMHE